MLPARAMDVQDNLDYHHATTIDLETRCQHNSIWTCTSPYRLLRRGSFTTKRKVTEHPSLKWQTSGVLEVSPVRNYDLLNLGRCFASMATMLKKKAPCAFLTSNEIFLLIGTSICSLTLFHRKASVCFVHKDHLVNAARRRSAVGKSRIIFI